jgi:putative ABC transport system permease protein
MAYIASQRTPEFGLRMALGAHPAMLLRLVLRSGMKLALTGALLGMAGALAMSRLTSSVVFGVSARDPLAFSLALAIMLVAALVATVIPALRAARIDPMVALRHE